jgi:hypothetical protein
MNAFLEFAEQRIAAPVKARERAAEKRAKTRTEALERRREDDTTCLREWRRWRQEEVTKALAGPRGKKLAALITDLKKARDWADIDPAAIAAAWQSADRETRALVTRITNAFVTCLRENAGLHPFNDPLPF